MKAELRRLDAIIEARQREIHHLVAARAILRGDALDGKPRERVSIAPGSIPSRVLEILKDKGAQSRTQLVKGCKAAEPSVVDAIRVLRQAGRIALKRNGLSGKVTYELRD